MGILNLSGYILICELLQRYFFKLSRKQQSKYTEIYFDQSLLNFILLVKSGRFLCCLSIGFPISFRSRFVICSGSAQKNSLNDNQSPEFPAI